jgi:thymidylate synthase
MAGRIAAKTTTQDGSINTADKTLLSSIKTDLSTRTEDLKNLVHFNNIVSSYLNISEGDGESKTLTRNTASLYAEVNSMNEKDSKVLRENIEKSKKDLKENQTTADLKVEDINEILKYNDPPPIP